MLFHIVQPKLRGSHGKGLNLHLIYEIADLTFLFWVISQKCSEITDFKDFEETFRNECSERNERRGTVVRSEAGSPLGCRVEDDGAPKRMERAE